MSHVISLSFAGIFIFLLCTNVHAEDISITANDEKTNVNLTIGKDSVIDVKPIASEPEPEQEEVPAKAIRIKRPTNAKLLLPDVTNDVPISITEINRISSDEEITSIKYDKKVANLIINFKGRNAYILYTDKTEVLAYIETENNVYPVRLLPAEVKATHYVLSDGDTVLGKKGPDHLSSDVNHSSKIHSTNKEKRFIEMLQYAYGNPQTEEGSTQISRLENINLISDIEIYKYKTYTFLDDGMFISVYLTRLSSSCSENEIEVSEKDFLVPEIGNYPIGISLEHTKIDKERYTRIFVLSASTTGGDNEI